MLGQWQLAVACRARTGPDLWLLGVQFVYHFVHLFLDPFLDPFLDAFLNAISSSLSSIAILESLFHLAHYRHNPPVAFAAVAAFVGPLDAFANCRGTSANLVDAQSHNSSLLPLNILSQHP